MYEKEKYMNKSHFKTSKKSYAKLIVILMLMITSCMRDRVDNRSLSIINNSNETIYWIRLYNDKFEKPENWDHDIILPTSNTYLIQPKPSWDDLIKSIEDGKLRIYIVNKDSVDKYGWDNVYKKNIFSKRYLIDMQYLEDNKWTIVYP